MRSTSFGFAAFLSIFLVFSTASADPPSFLQLQQDFPLNGGTSRFDYQTFDSDNSTLYIAHMGAGQILVFNTRFVKLEATLAGYPGVTGLLVVPERHRLYASVSRRHELVVIDTQSLREITHISAGNFPDGIAYVPDTHQIYVSDEIGGQVTVIDVEKNQKVTSIKMDGQVGNVRYDATSHMVLVNGQAKNELVVIDPRYPKIINRYPIHGGKHPHGLCLDPNSHLAFIACDGDEKLTIMDLSNFQEIGVSEVGKDPDVMAFDVQLGYLYVASEAGVVSIFRVRDKKIEKIGDFPVGQNAHSVEIDPATHSVYFPLRKVNKGPVLRVMKPVS